MDLFRESTVCILPLAKIRLKVAPKRSRGQHPEPRIKKPSIIFRLSAYDRWSGKLLVEAITHIVAVMCGSCKDPGLAPRDAKTRFNGLI
jgi:hypothetical protein